MRLPYEESLSAQPFLLTESYEQRKRDVARLEFKSANHRGECPADVEPIVEQAESSLEIEALKEQFRLEAAQFQVRLQEAERRVGDAVRAESSEEFTRNLAAERERIANLYRCFERERLQYFAKVEPEVVKLALAIAERVVQREVKIDALLLRGVVRVELERLRDAGIITLRVPVQDLALWRETLATVKEGSFQVRGDEGLLRGDCVLESSAGSMNLGIQSQLQEIERGFLDLLEKRPA